MWHITFRVKDRWWDADGEAFEKAQLCFLFGPSSSSSTSQCLLVQSCHNTPRFSCVTLHIFPILFTEPVMHCQLNALAGMWKAHWKYISESAAACQILKTNILFQPHILDRSPLRCFDLCFARALRQGNETEETAEWTGGRPPQPQPPMSCVWEAKFNVTFLSCAPG